MNCYCYKCSKNVSSNHHHLFCNICGNSFHVKCTTLSKFAFRDMSDNDKTSWICADCVNLFPYNQITDNNVFNKLALGTYSSTMLTNCEDMIFNPFEHLSDESGIMNYDTYDPDINHFDQHCNVESICNSKYFDSLDFNNEICQRNAPNKSFSMIHCNLRSAHKNSIHLRNYCTTLDLTFDVLALSETWLHKNNDDISGFPHYNQLHNFRKNKVGGGVSILLRDNIQYKELDHLSTMSKTMESIFAEIYMTEKNIIVGCIYRPPNSDMVKFIEEITILINKINKLNKHVYLMGDFNVDLLQYNNHSMTSEFIDVMFSTYYIPLINRPTRVTDSSATLIDNIYTNCLNNENSISGILPTDISDHFPIFHILFDRQKSETITKPVFKRKISFKAIDKFNKCIHESKWDSVLDKENTQTAYCSFVNTFSKIYNDTFPMEQCKEASNIPKKPWITKNLLDCIIKKNTMYKKLKVKFDTSLYSEYKIYKNRLTGVLKHYEKQYYKKLLERNKNNLAKTWKTLNFLIGRKKKLKITSKFNHNNLEITEDKDISNHFNDYYLNMAKELHKNLSSHTQSNINSTGHKSYLRGSFGESIYLNPTDEEEISYIISSLNNGSPGHDGFDMKLIKNVKLDILSPITHVCNLSLTEGIFPSELKIAKVIPIYKKGSKDQFSNYRPVSVLSAFSKIFERLIYNRFINFFEKNDTLNNSQFGFRKNRSTSMAITNLTDAFHKSIEKHEYLLGLFIDLSRAFDTISHEILFDKLDFYGIRGVALTWIKNYLSERKQYVSYNDVNSDMGTLSTGVPQGSILGPLLFLIYINDLPNTSTKLSFIQFADDTTLYLQGSSLTDIFNIMNEEIDIISQWLKVNKLVLNISKTNYMVMSSKKNKIPEDLCKIKINGHQIEQVSETKFLGVMIDNKMSWKSHIDYINSKIMRGVGIIRRAKNFVYKDTLKTLYVALIQPYLTYCIVNWGGTYPSYLQKLHVSQKKIIRIISNSGFNSHTEPLFKELCLMNIFQLHEYFVGAFVFKCLSDLLPNIFHNYFTPNIHNRNGITLQSMYHSKKMCESSLKISGPKIWNALHVEIRKSMSVHIFKKSFKSKLFN